VVEGYLLDQFSPRDLRAWDRYRDDVLGFHWSFYTALLDQRTRVRAAIAEAVLRAATGPFDFEDWHRVVPYEFSLEPLSSAGSVKSANGGRFNMGGVDSVKFPEFSALYLAADRETALAEKLGVPSQQANDFTVLDLALRTEGSISMVVVEGHLETVIDLRQMDRLRPLVDVIAAFKIPDELQRRARRIGLPAPTVVRTVDQLFNVLVHPQWREFPAIFDVPATSQIFGQELRAVGIEGIVYPSSKTATICAAVFPENLVSGSFVQLADPAPPGVVQRLDSTSWRGLV
jgi:hypothetical protein